MFLKFKQFFIVSMILGCFGLVSADLWTGSVPQLDVYENGNNLEFDLLFNYNKTDLSTGLVTFGQNVDYYTGAKSNSIDVVENLNSFIFSWGNEGFYHINFSGNKTGFRNTIDFFVESFSGTSKEASVDINNLKSDVDASNLVVHDYTYTDKTITFTFDYTFGDSINSNFSIEDEEGNEIDGNFEVSNENEYQVEFNSDSSLDNGNYVLNINDGADFKTKGVLSGSFEYEFELKDLEQTSKPIGLEIGNGTGISINQGADETRSKVVNLRLKADSADKMCIWNENNGCNNNWVAYTEDKYSWTIKGDINQENTVNVQFKNNTGESDTYSSSINYNKSEYFIGFSSLSGRYAQNNTISLKGRCVLEDSSFSGKNGTTKSIDCINTNWSGSFNLSTGLNTIKLRSGSNYTDAEIRNSLAIRYYEDDITYTYEGIKYTIDIPNSNGIVEGIKDISDGQKKLKFEFEFYDDGTYDFTRVGSPYIQCDTDFELNDEGNACIEKQEDEDTGSSSGGGGGGGGGLSTCRAKDLVCKEHMGEYIWVRKDGVSCRGGDLSETCSPDDLEDKDQDEDKDKDDDGTDQNIIDPVDEKQIDSMDNKQLQNYLKTNFTINPKDLSNIPVEYTRQIAKQMSKPSSFDKVKSNISQKAPSEYADIIQKLVNILEKNPTSKFVNRYGQFGVKLKNFQNKYYNSFEQMVINLFKYAQTSNKINANLVKFYLKYYNIYSNQYQDIKLEYVRLQENNRYIPVDKNLVDGFKALESIIFKYETDNLLEAYNDFVFAIVIYRKDNDTKALEKAKSLAKKLINNYKQAQSIVKQQAKEAKQSNNKVSNETDTSKDTETVSYKFDTSISLGDRGDHISDLQNFLASKGYRYPNFDTTNYYGDISATWLKQYLQEQHNLYIDTAQISQNLLNTYISPYIQ